jgi:hypothetical protein
MIKDGQCFNSAEFRISYVDRSALQLSRIAGLSSHDHEDSLRVYRNREGNRIILIVLSHGDGRHDNNLMRVDDAGLMCLGSAYNDTVISSLYNAEVQIRIRLCVRRLGSVSLRVCHGSVDDKVFLLNILHELQEILMVMCAMCLVTLIGRAEYRVECVHSYASLEASRGLLAEQSLHLDLVSQVLCALMNMSKTVYSLSDVGRHRRHQILILRLLCEIIGHTHGIQ